MKNDLKTCVDRIGGQELCLETGVLAKQANGSVVVKYGETVVLGTATMRKAPNNEGGFMPLLVDYEEKFYAAGKIKGSRFVKREGRPHDDAILTSRLIDRSIRPLFPDGMLDDVQVVLTVLSYDGENDPAIPAMVAAFGALTISDIPWSGKLAAVRVGQVDGKFVINPTTEEQKQSTLDLILAGNDKDVVMVEAGAHEITEEGMLDAIEYGQKAMGKIVALLSRLQAEAGKAKKEPTLQARNEDGIKRVEGLAEPVLREKLGAAHDKETIGAAERETDLQVLEQLSEEEKETMSQHFVREVIHELHGRIARERILEEEVRSDGRKLDQVRPLHVEVGVLPRTHGSALFQRGDTQILTTVTLGGPTDMLIVDTMKMEEKKRYVHYYNFPAYSVGEVKPSRGPGRREVGHGALAERALVPLLPEKEAWPYMMLLVSEVLESHGSSSMGSVCGSSMALMQAGVPLKKACAGVAMGLMTDGKGKFKVLTDIAGMEDEKGDMDFKVAGTKDGITAIQMDIKIGGLSREILSAALDQAKAGRLHIMETMNAAIAEPNKEMSPYAPRIHTLRVPVEKIGDLIGPKGKHINAIIEETGVEIDIDDDGLVSITTNDKLAMEKAIDWVKNMTREIVAGERFDGKVTRIMNFGAFVELVPGVEGMVHISQFSDERIESVDTVAKVGDIIPVVVVEIDAMGRINLSHKAAKSDKPFNPADYKTERRGSGGGRGDRKPFRGGNSDRFSGPRPPR
ncbi:MAG: polyribonucleotide nucleotidyltransferase [Candidatus Andersenbacteria bacterium]|nr:polyribonucleotide nucleotidyltransferase [Candidatus Andersenbacteria bacterium]MBI3250652.1 polyribonucleotide nucleotidyltransferase [Candidatus Andersenbacteria bacterium]